MLMKDKKVYVLLGFAFLLLLFVGVIIFVFLGGKPAERPTPGQPNIPTPTFFPSVTPIPLTVSVEPPAITSLPRNPRLPNAVDTTAPSVQASQQEVAKILSSLPYEKELKLTGGSTISILIPGREYQQYPWKLTVQVFNVDYQVAENSPEYALMRNAFLEGANDIFTQLQSLGADPEKIIFTWGDRAYIQERAVEWLQSANN